MASYVVSAEPYGFGPVAKAVAIASELSARGADVHFVGTGIAAQFARESSGVFASFHTSIRSVDDLDVDAVVSVMEPSAALYGRARGVRVVYVDSLYWMWHWQDHDVDRLEALAARFRAIPDVQETLDRLAEVEMHDSQYVAHRLATEVCVQRYGKTTGQVRGTLSPVEVGAIVDRRHHDPERPKDVLLASISGSVNPLADPAAARRWVETVLQVLVGLRAAAATDLEVWVTGNPRILEQIDEPAAQGVRFRPQAAHAGYLDLLNRAACVLAPPGITSIAEAWAYGVPFVSLPQQHYAHSDIWDRVVGAAGDASVFPDLMIDRGQAGDGDLVQRTTAMLDGVADTYSAGFDPTAGRAVLDLLDQVARGDGAAVRDRQSAALGTVFGGPDGLREVADIVTGGLRR